MLKGKLIVIEGTDCSGKSTQINLLLERLKKENIKVVTLDFPNYTTPTGKIVRKYLDNEFGQANTIDPRLASILYAEDRFASKPIIEKALEENDLVILDRYVESNMGHQGGKVTNPLIREQFFKWLEELEYQILGLPKPDAVFFFHMPHLVSLELKKNRIRKSEFHPSTEDGHESNLEHLKNAENAYLQLASLYNWKKISCAPDGTISSLRTPENISEEFYFAITEILNKNLTLNELQEIIMKQAKEKGFGTTPEEINTPEKISLIHSEVSEAFEAFRKKNIDGKDGLKEELGDVIQRVLHLCGIYHIDVEREILKKISNNKNRVWNWDKMNEQHV